MVVSGFAQIQAQLQYRVSGCSIGLPVVVGTTRGGGGGPLSVFLQGGRLNNSYEGFCKGSVRVQGFLGCRKPNEVTHSVSKQTSSSPEFTWQA